MNPVTITIVRRENGDMEIVDGDRTTRQLGIGEVIEMVIRMLYPEMPGPRYPMHTPDEWRALYPKWNYEHDKPEDPK